MTRHNTNTISDYTQKKDQIASVPNTKIHHKHNNTSLCATHLPHNTPTQLRRSHTMLYHSSPTTEISYHSSSTSLSNPHQRAVHHVHLSITSHQHHYLPMQSTTHPSSHTSNNAQTHTTTNHLQTIDRKL